MASIRHSPKAPFGLSSGELPDFRNLGVALRLVFGVNALALVAALLGEPDWSLLPGQLPILAAHVEPAVFFCLLLLYGLQPVLARLDARVGMAAVVAAAASCALAGSALLLPLGGEFSWRPALWGGGAAFVLVHYLSLRQKALSPALAEARLMALTARIRPHFLFNSLNGVLGILREDARRAETALEELSDLFRVLMADNRELVSLGQEMVLGQQYLDLERLRLGDRLVVNWGEGDCPADCLVPSLLLQPLLENAVYHGIEPSSEPGEILVRFSRLGSEIRVEISNPWHGEHAHGQGNRMALENVRERLMLFFDLEARLETEVKDGKFRLEIWLPYRPGPVGEGEG
ncbi:MAG: histidine kinase [Rhodocyclaceae bacterium]|nr:histidine kinase [Rhodocyclaceae bacterium]